MAMEDPPQCAHSKASQARFFIDGQKYEFLIEMFHVYAYVAIAMSMRQCYRCL